MIAKKSLFHQPEGARFFSSGQAILWGQRRILRVRKQIHKPTTPPEGKKTSPLLERKRPSAIKPTEDLLIFRRLASFKFLVECFYSTSSSMYTLFTAVERMALRTDFYFNIMFCSRSGFKFITASADNFYSFILWVNSFFHSF